MRDYVVLDVFTNTPLQGNPLAVFPDGRGLDGGLMQRTARELNLSETVFVLDGGDGLDARLRIFTPAAELPFAGHPTLGAAFVVGARSGASAVRLGTGAGEVGVALRREGDTVVFGEMEQPLPVLEEVPDPAPLLRALGLSGSRLPVEGYRNGPLHIYVMLEDAEAVNALRPDLGAVAQAAPGGVQCFALADGHVETRSFCPALGVPEDPATGSAAGPLAVHLARHGVIEWGAEIEIHQGTAMGRPSVLFASAQGSGGEPTEVRVGGGAVQVAEGRYRLD